MMFQICDKNPEKAVIWLAENTSKSHCWKSLLELSQLICSAGISEVYKKVNSGKEIQAWILKNKYWTYRFYTALLFWCMRELNLRKNTLVDLHKIRYDLWDSSPSHKRCSTPKVCIFRYKKGYASEYPTNSELPIDVCTEEYRKYIKSYKFKEEN